jgi:low temperature requirement protein LtrA
MSDSSIIDRLRATDIYVADVELPESAWSPEVAFAEVQRLIDGGPGRQQTARRVPLQTGSGWRVGAIAFSLVLFVGVALYWAIGFGVDEEPVATTAVSTTAVSTTVPTTSVPPTTGPPPSTEPPGAPLDSAAQTAVTELERAYNRGDSEAVAVLLTPGVEVSLAPWVSPEDSPSAVSLPDRVATASIYGESVRLAGCSQIGERVSCNVTVTDRFSELVAVDPWVQNWDIEMDAGRIARITATGEDSIRADAMVTFQQWVIDRDPTATALVAGRLEWHRTAAAGDVFNSLVVEYAAQQSGVPVASWAQISAFYESLSSGDIAGTEALFAPGGIYEMDDRDGDFSTALFPIEGEIGSTDEGTIVLVGLPELTEFWTFWYGMLHMRWAPLDCTGDAVTVTCQTQSRGLGVAHLPGGTATGRVVFTLGPEGIERVLDQVKRTSGFDIRGFWRTWMPENAPEVEAMWPGGNGFPADGYTVELARAIVELYAPFLADRGLNVPPEYLDGSVDVGRSDVVCVDAGEAGPLPGRGDGREEPRLPPPAPLPAITHLQSHRMKGIELPPLTEDFTADPVELFFDLAYVFAFSQLVGLLIHDPTWAGVGKAALLFGLLWLPWQQLTWAANAVSGNGRPVRLLFVVATVVSIPMAASTSTAYEGGGPVFAIALTGIMLIGFRMQTLGAGDDVDYRSVIYGWIAPNAIAIAVLVVGSFYDGTIRILFWLGTAAIVLWAMIRAADGEWLVRPGHFAERHGLIIIIALGEVIVAIGIPVVAALEKGDTLSAATISALLASGGFAGLLWWAYFDRPGPGLEYAASRFDGKAIGRYIRDVYTWAHAPLVAGIILSAAALEEIALHPRDHVELEFRIMLAGGLVLFLIGVFLAVWRAFRAQARERLVGAILIAALVLAGASLEGVLLLTLVVVIMFIVLFVEHRRIEQLRLHRELEADPHVD